LIYKIGIIFGKQFRKWYWRTHNHKYYWGIVRYVSDFNNDVAFDPAIEKFLDDLLYTKNTVENKNAKHN